MRLLELIETMQINESAKSRYMSMLNGMPNLMVSTVRSRTLPAVMKHQIDWALEYLRRDDRIIWFLKWTRAYYTKEAWSAAFEHYKRGGTHPDYQIKTDYEAIRAYLNKIKPDPWMLNQDARLNEAASQLNTWLGHYMSLPIPEIQNYQFRDQNPDSVRHEFYQFEQEWKKTSRRILAEPEDATVVVKLPDGSAWFNLNKSYCDVEAGAMGHCGNKGNPKDEDTVLSYRTPKKVGSKTMWEPHLTFILDTRNGLLGEMKGRGNDKPVAKYHPAIIALLENPIVKGIKGGGYLPQNNFSINDLPEDIREKLITEKPALNLKANLESFYFPENFTDPRVVERAKQTLAMLGLNVPDFTGETKMFDYGGGDELPEILLFKTNKPMSDTLEELAKAKGHSWEGYKDAEDADSTYQSIGGLYVGILANCLRSLETGDYSWVSEQYNIPAEYVESHKEEFERVFKNIRRSFEATINNDPEIAPHLISDGSGTKVYLNADEFAKDVQLDANESFDEWPGSDIRAYLYDKLYVEIGDLYDGLLRFIHRTISKANPIDMEIF